VRERGSKRERERGTRGAKKKGSEGERERGCEAYLSQRGQHRWMLLQLEELADEILLRQTERLQLTEDLLEDLREREGGRGEREREGGREGGGGREREREGGRERGRGML